MHSIRICRCLIIWGTVGYRRYHPPGEDEASIGNSIYRFNPEGSDLTFLAQFSNNTWGLEFSETFDIFGSTANNEHSVYVGIPLPYVQEFEDAEPYQPIELSKDQPEKLLQALHNENLFWRLRAQRLLVGRSERHYRAST